MYVSRRLGPAAALLCTLVLTSAARAGIASEPAGSPDVRRDRSGVYLGLGGDVGAQFASGADAKLGFGGEAKLGYAVNRGLQLYLSGSVNNATYDTVSQQLILLTAHLHRFLYQNRAGLGVFYDGGVGLGFASPGFSSTPAAPKTGIGLGYAGSLGVEIPLGSYVSLVPEFYYRGVSTSENPTSGQISAIGLQLGVVYY